MRPRFFSLLQKKNRGRPLRRRFSHRRRRFGRARQRRKTLWANAAKASFCFVNENAEVSACGGGRTTATPFLLSLAKEETVLRAKEERRFWARFLQAQTSFPSQKRCFRDFIDFATIAASGGAMVLQDRLPASLRPENAARRFCLQVVSAQRSGFASSSPVLSEHKPARRLCEEEETQRSERAFAPARK